MSLSILTNVASLQAQNNLSKTTDALTKNIQHLSSGQRINDASDDAAGLAISSRLTAELGGYAQAQRNGNDGVSMIQTADGALGDVNTLLTRMRELAVESANGGTLGTSDRASLDTEFQALSSEIGRIVSVTAYNGQTLLDGSVSATNFQVGAFNTTNDQIAITIGSSTLATLGLTASNVTSQANALTSLTALDTAINDVASTRASIGASETRLTAAIDNLSSIQTNLAAGNSRILDVDVAAETASLTRNQILMQAGISVLATANQLPSSALALLK